VNKVRVRHPILLFLSIVSLFIIRACCFPSLSRSLNLHSLSIRLDSTPLFASAETNNNNNGFDLSSNLISQLAAVALKLRLSRQDHVSCDATCTSQDLLRGRCGPVTVRGRGWASARGLTCRVIAATVQECKLDVNRMAKDQKLLLLEPARGTAMIAMNANDFGNFITHPLVRPPVVTLNKNTPPLVFLKDNVQIDTASGFVVFYFSYMDETYKAVLKRNLVSGAAMVGVLPANKTEGWKTVARALNDTLSKFFNELVFELDGTFLSFRDMMTTDKGGEPKVLLSLDIVVYKFPSPGLEF
jgi:hypothetical protein